MEPGDGRQGAEHGAEVGTRPLLEGAKVGARLFLVVVVGDHKGLEFREPI